LSIHKKKLFLSKAERDYLMANSDVSGGYSRVIKSRLQKKIEVFVNRELPILVEKGYLDVTEFRNGSVTENCNRQEGEDSMVTIPTRTSDNQLSYEHVITKTTRKSGPKGIRTLDPRHVKAVS
jgi:hypothetical protein